MIWGNMVYVNRKVAIKWTLEVMRTKCSLWHLDLENQKRCANIAIRDESDGTLVANKV